MGVDTWAAECVVSAKEKNPNIKLAAVLPYKEYNNFVTDFRDLNVLNHSDEVIIVGEHKSMSMLKMRDRYMIDNSGRMIAVYDERSKSKKRNLSCFMLCKRKKY